MLRPVTKIVVITGEGRTGEFKDAYIKQYPDSPTWGSGQVRVKRSIIWPHFDYTPVEAGFLLMPADITDIDGGAEVESSGSPATAAGGGSGCEGG